MPHPKRGDGPTETTSDSTPATNPAGTRSFCYSAASPCPQQSAASANDGQRRLFRSGRTEHGKKLEVARSPQFAPGGRLFLRSRNCSGEWSQYPKHETRTIEINPDNIRFLQNRFRDDPTIHFVQTNGVQSPSEVPGGVTFVYCFDAMVHGGYLKENSLASWHREPWDSFIIPKFHAVVPRIHTIPRQNFAPIPIGWGTIPTIHPHQRNAHSKQDFVDQATKAGLIVLKQIDVSVGGVPNMDAISIIQKPK